MALHLTAHRGGFSLGLTEITRIGEAEHDTGIGLSVLKLAAGATHAERAPSEVAFLLMDGKAVFEAGGSSHEVSRGSLFDELPSCLHAAAGSGVKIRALSAVELTVYRTTNARSFAPRVYRPEDVRDEPRGRGMVKNTAFRFVRTIFDRTNAPPEAELVLGEVVNLPGRWSSYPPHHHPQPEIYHYRFTRPEGYGHAELGDAVLKVKNYDTVKIFDGNDHSQCAAPGYGMYYSWVIRHLPGLAYDVPEFSEEHRWLLAPGAACWWPRGVGEGE